MKSIKIACHIVFLFLFMCGCKESDKGTRIISKKLPSPSIAISVSDSSGFEDTSYYNLISFAVSKRATDGGIAQHEISINDETSISIALFKKEDDLKTPGNKLLSFEITYNSEIYSINDISWNLRDDLEIGGGANWRIWLTNYAITP